MPQFECKPEKDKKNLINEFPDHRKDKNSFEKGRKKRVGEEGRKLEACGFRAEPLMWQYCVGRNCKGSLSKSLEAME